MKITDDYRGKIRLWASHPTVVPWSPPQLPVFSPQKFASHQEMNRWKRELLKRVAREIAPHG